MAPIKGDQLNFPMAEENYAKISDILDDQQQECLDVAQTYLTKASNLQDHQELEKDPKITHFRYALEFLSQHNLISQAAYRLEQFNQYISSAAQDIKWLQQ